MYIFIHKFVTLLCYYYNVNFNNLQNNIPSPNILRKSRVRTARLFYFFAFFKSGISVSAKF